MALALAIEFKVLKPERADVVDMVAPFISLRETRFNQ
jgi:hypothetical protein